MTGVMDRLARRDMAAEITGLGRKDEVGAMAAAVQVFKDSMIRSDQLAAEQRVATSEIARNVQQTAQAVTVNITGVNRAPGETGAAGELSQQSERLGAEVRAFVAGVRAA